MIKYLKDQAWTVNDLNDHQWRMDGDDDLIYGKITDNNDLYGEGHMKGKFVSEICTNGICINPKGWVWIGYYEEHGYISNPYLHCNADKCEIV